MSTTQVSKILVRTTLSGKTVGKSTALTSSTQRSISTCSKCLVRREMSSLSRKLFHKQWKVPPSPLGASFHNRLFNTSSSNQDSKAYSMIIYITGGLVTMFGVAYAGVPLYKKFCQANGLGGQAEAVGHDRSKIKSMKPVRDRPIKVQFVADTHSTMQWNFKPTQSCVEVVPGETALAFFKAKNPTDKPIIGVSTYNVLPYKAALYFNKIQCFCFEEQRLNPHEEVDMPVFFYIDPEYDLDADLMGEDNIILSYKFFEAKPGMEIPLPDWMKQMNNAQPVASS